MCMYQMHFSCTLETVSLAAAGRFSRSRLRGTQGASGYTTAQVWVAARLRGARPGRFKSRDLASHHGRPMESPKTPFVFQFFTSLLLFLKHYSSCPRLGSHGTTTALEAFPFVMATKCGSACVFVSACVRMCHHRILQQ